MFPLSDDNLDDAEDSMPLLLRQEAILNKKKEGEVKEDRNFTCKYCKKTFSFKYKLLMHMRVHTKEKPYKCDVCNLSFSLKGNLRRHKMIHTGEKPHICDTCGKGINNNVKEILTIIKIELDSLLNIS